MRQHDARLRRSIQFAVVDAHELLGEKLAAVLLDDAAALPAHPVTVAREEGVDLVGHVLLKLVLAGRFDPRALGLHDAEPTRSTP